MMIQTTLFCRPLTLPVCRGFAVVAALAAAGLLEAGTWGRAAQPGEVLTLSRLAHGVAGSATVLDNQTIALSNFFYDGLGPAVYAYLGTNDSPIAFEHGIAIGPQFTQSFSNATVTLALGGTNTLDFWGALSIWCVAARQNFGSGAFGAATNVAMPGPPGPQPGDSLVLPSLAHKVGGLATVIDARTVVVSNFFYDGTAPQVYFYLGTNDSQAAFHAGRPIGPLLDRRYRNETVRLELPANETLAGYPALSVWCVEFRANFGSGTFEAAPALRWSVEMKRPRTADTVRLRAGKGFRARGKVLSTAQPNGSPLPAVRVAVSTGATNPIAWVPAVVSKTKNGMARFRIQGLGADLALAPGDSLSLLAQPGAPGFRAAGPTNTVVLQIR